MTVALVAAAAVMVAMVVVGLIPVKPPVVQMVVLLALAGLAALGLVRGIEKWGDSAEGVVFVWVVFGPGLVVAVIRLLLMVLSVFRRDSGRRTSR